MYRKFLSVLLVSFLFLVSPASGEGTKQIRPDSTYMCDLWVNDGWGVRSCFATVNCDPEQRLYIHIAQPGEKIFMGFYASVTPLEFYIRLGDNIVYSGIVHGYNGAPGQIKYHSQAVAGPLVLDPHGYDPLTFTPSEAGDYSIDFTVPSTQDHIGIRLLDITVIDTTQIPWTPVEGRLWSQDWGFNTGNNNGSKNAMLGVQYILTTDSIVTSLNYNKMRGWNFDITSTRNGCFRPPWPWNLSCRSCEGNHHYAEYKIFISDPDSLEYPTGTPGMFLGDTVGITKGCDGTMQFAFHVSKPGDVQLELEANLTPGIQAEDISVKYTVNQGLNIIQWDGLNALGIPVTCGDSVNIKFTFINGLTNIALYDVETHPQGFIIEPVRPPGLPVATYWNDTLLASQGGSLQLSGCYPMLPDTGCHSWIGDVGSGIGSENTINTWWYAGSSILELGRVRVECIPHTPQDILGDRFPCTWPPQQYTVDPTPLPGSEPSGYEWILTEVSTGALLMDSSHAGPTITIDFSLLPAGRKRLRVRGVNDLCGPGSFGPGAGGIFVEPVTSPAITNTVTRYAICSGDSVEILLTADPAGTGFSYTVTASSPSVTGQMPGTVNPIRQQLFNTGNAIDSVMYSAVPFLNPCQGDTVRVTVIVSPTDTVIYHIAASADPVCTGDSVSLSVDPPVGDTGAHYHWYVNLQASGPDLPLFTYVPEDGDEITCLITSGYFCTPNNQAVTDLHKITLAERLPTAIHLIPSSIPVCEGEPVKVTAAPVNGGDNPAWHWWLNGVALQADSSVIEWIPEHGDELIGSMIPGLVCVTDSMAWDTLILFVQGPVKFTDTLLCYGVPYFAEGGWQTEPGIYHDTLDPPVACVSYVITTIQYKQEIPLELGEDRPLCEEFLLLDASCPGGTYLWQDGSAAPDYQAVSPGIYSVQVTVDGCRKTDSITLEECPVRIWIPTAFTPNGDGLNDRFRITGDELSAFSMQIYTRWGELIFHTGDQESGWDGMCGEKSCPSGAYVYLIHYRTIGGTSYQAKGYVSLIR